MAQQLTESERMFEGYLGAHSFTNWDHEPDIQGSRKHPDYRVSLPSCNLYLEVKEFEASKEFPSGAFCLDPYKPIREKLNVAQKQLHPFKGHACAVVLANPHGALVDLDPFFVIGAMLGDAGVEMPYDASTGHLDSSMARSSFLRRGKMIKYRDDHPWAPQNTTISAICVLTHLDEHWRQFRVELAKRRPKQGASWTVDELTETERALAPTLSASSDCRSRLIVVENPLAVLPFPSTFGNGAFDERIGVKPRDGRVHRKFCGRRLAKLEAEERKWGVEVSDLLRVKGGHRRRA